MDHDPDACATFGLNFQNAQVVRGDIRESKIQEQIVRLASGVDVVVGGPPCQAFSQVRNHSRFIDDPRNSLYREFVAVLGRLTPSAFVMENVPGMDQMGVRDQVLEDLRLGGAYEVTHQILDAADFGVPQMRQRLIFVGTRVDLPLVKFKAKNTPRMVELARENGGYRVRPVPLEGAEAVYARLLDPEDLGCVSVEQAIGDLVGLTRGSREDVIESDYLSAPTSSYQRLMRGDERDGIVTNVQVPRMRDDTEMRLQAIPEGGNHLDLPEEMTRRYLSDDRWGQHNGSGQLTRKHYYAYRRLHRGSWAWTLNTKADAAYHYEACRALSVREFARLQSFPDSFRFTTHPTKGAIPGRIAGGQAHSRYRQVGNAVPPLLAQGIATALAGALRQKNVLRTCETEFKPARPSDEVFESATT